MHKRTVGETMTPDPILLAPAMTVDAALELAQEKHVHHLLVQGDDGAVNVVCLCDLLGRDPLDDSFEGVNHVPNGHPLADFARRRTFVVAPSDSLESAAHLMAGEGIGCLPVVDDGRIVGVLTRADLGKVDAAFDAVVDGRCDACGSVQDVRHAVPGGAGFCPSCWSDGGPPAREEELGSGD